MKKLMAALIGLSLGVAAVCAWAQTAAKPDPDDEKLQGTWTVAAAEAEGMALPAAVIAKIKLTFAKGKLTLGDGKDGEKYEYQLDSSKSPKHIDLTQRSEVLSKDSKKSVRVETKVGIFELKGDELKLCYNDDDESKTRPTEFKSKAGTRMISLTLKRMK